ncbi:cupin fold metalloprotein, WbuC family [Leclercia sp. J807]|uniref:WbuC family cupin fold metalloprotein n=1 Tax=Leclercia sp. J807 TaxID=2681307 RepID=UPI0012E203CD|nr:WbuC family cupin fold metalloprotein [Leclercia sp. J807]QGU11510.1 cupin fold metalloprotein, WbuC family [Leclercia sp. J807]
MRLIDNEQLDSLYKEAEQSERLRSHLLLHASHQDKVQRLLIAMKKGSYVDPHFHLLKHQWEMFTIIQGQVQVCLYNDEGALIKRFTAGQNTGITVVEFAPGDIHSVECITEQALMLEVKEGPFDPAYAKSFPQW